jgi:hypothetical protein
LITYDSERGKSKISGWFLGRKNANWIKEDLGTEGPFFFFMGPVWGGKMRDNVF